MTAPMLQVEEALSRILSATEPIDDKVIALQDALGRVLREDLVAPFDIPAADNTAMDGYAVRAADVAGATREAPVLLDVVETVPAGYVPMKRVGEGQASRIMTGAMIPAGADAVVIVEVTDAEDRHVRVYRDAKPGANIRRRGEDVRQGQVVVPAGSIVGPGEIGLLASIRAARVRVGRRPVVAIVSTGDELVEVDQTPGPGQIVNSNAYSLASLVDANGGRSQVLPIARDTIGEIKDALREASTADVVVTSGGVSVGEFDYVKAALDEMGASIHFWRVAMKPGKPVVFGRLGRAPFFGLPGNPVSCMVGFHLFVRPALRRMLGVPDDELEHPIVRAVLANDVRSSGDRRNYQRAVLRAVDGRLVARTKPAQGSGVLSSMVGANGLVIVPEGTTVVSAGEEVSILLIGPLA